MKKEKEKKTVSKKISDRKEFEITSDLDAIPQIVKQIINDSVSLFEDLYMLEVAVYEAIYNAIEHGNLEITRRKKEKLLENGTYDGYLKGKTEKKVCNERKVKIISTVESSKQMIEIEDEGKGFDWKKEITAALNMSDLNPEGFNGFGLKIMISVFDEVFYNEKGNRLTLVKYKNITGGKIEKNTHS